MREYFDQAAVDEDVRRLSRILYAKKGKADFLILERSQEGSHSDAARLQAGEDILAANGINSVRIDLFDFSTTGALQERLGELAAEGIGAVQLLNGDTWLTQRERFNDDMVVRAQIMNLRRENLFMIPIKIMLWLSPEKIDDFSRHAPDLFAWRAGIYVLGPGPVYDASATPPGAPPKP